ncbi:hypothetical protein [Acrocarpospora sp. B8E8]|uniref:hypothetical protein n=1 Tax=Acrocarpospora sp. B8E8 TaxID=3153572 RepID=UPI00325CC090
MKVISFSLYGSDPMYQLGAIRNLELRDEFYPGWACRFYIGDSIGEDVREKLLAHRDVQLVPMAGEPEDWFSTSWRFRALAHDHIEAHLFRDCDSRPDAREQSAVFEWLQSGKDFHIMRDHPEHGAKMLSGMWGCTRRGARQIWELLPAEHGADYYQVDQHWLRDRVYPIARKSLMVHDEFFDFEPDRRPFPIPRRPGRFVGQGFTGSDELRIPHDATRV